MHEMSDIAEIKSHQFRKIKKEKISFFKDKLKKAENFRDIRRNSNVLDDCNPQEDEVQNPIDLEQPINNDDDDDKDNDSIIFESVKPKKNEKDINPDEEFFLKEEKPIANNPPPVALEGGNRSPAKKSAMPDLKDNDLLYKSYM